MTKKDPLDEALCENPPLFAHKVPCCGMIVSLGTKDDGKETRMVITCPIHGEVNPDECSIVNWGGGYP